MWVAPLALVVFLIAGCGYADPYSQPGQVAAVGTPSASPSENAGGDTCHEGSRLRQIKFPDGVSYTDVKVGNGARAQEGDSITFDYSLFLASNCNLVQSSKSPGGSPYTGPLTSGSGGFVTGFVEGVRGMKVGGVRRVFVTSAQGYGPTPQGTGIPGNADLIFIVTMRGVTAATPSPTAS